MQLNESAHNRFEDKVEFPYGVSRYYASLAKVLDPYTDPIAAQFLPRKEENTQLAYESADPISDDTYLVSPRLIHHYHDRALLLVNDRCATYCRHCFRRHFTGNADGKITEAEIDSAADYLQDCPVVEELILSGGDPLMLSDLELSIIIGRIRTRIDRPLLFRLASRMPVVLPARITEDLVDMLLNESEKRIWVIIHANHPRELTKEFERACFRLIDRGIPLMNQTVLLRGVNNSVDVLETLFRRLIQLRIKPYYLFQADLASGTSHFRTSIEEGLRIMDGLRSRLSGLAMPTYAVDLPGGGGKIPLNWGEIQKIRNGFYVLHNRQGKEFLYPREVQG